MRISNTSVILIPAERKVSESALPLERKEDLLTDSYHFLNFKKKNFFQPVLSPIPEVKTPESPDTLLFKVSPLTPTESAAIGAVSSTSGESSYISPENSPKNIHTNKNISDEKEVEELLPPSAISNSSEIDSSD